MYLHVHVYLNKHIGAIILGNKCVREIHNIVTVHFVLGLYATKKNSPFEFHLCDTEILGIPDKTIESGCVYDAFESNVHIVSSFFQGLLAPC